MTFMHTDMNENEALSRQNSRYLNKISHTVA